MVIHVFSQTNGEIIVKAMHSFIIFTQEEKDLGHNVLVHSLPSFMIWVQKVTFSLVLPDIFVLFSAAAQPPPLPPVDGCGTVTVGSHAPLYLYFALTFRLYWWRNIADCRPTLALKVIFLFPFPTLYPNLFLFFSNILPLVLHSAILHFFHPLCPLHSCISTPPFSPNVCLIPHLPYFSVASSQANNQLINRLSPRIIVAALRGALWRPSCL